MKIRLQTLPPYSTPEVSYFDSFEKLAREMDLAAQRGTHDHPDKTVVFRVSLCTKEQMEQELREKAAREAFEAKER